MSYEEEQARLLKLWEEFDNVEEPDDDEEELITEDDLVENRGSGSDTEQEGDEENGSENCPPAKKARVPSFIGKDGTTVWKKQCSNKKVRTRQDNIVIRLPGVKQVAKNAKSILECWTQFFSDRMLRTVVDNRNRYI